MSNTRATATPAEGAAGADRMNVRLATEIPGCVLRPWAFADKAALLRNADNRNVWRNLMDRFPHPYTDADADTWLASARQPGRSVHFAIEIDGSAAGGIGAIALEDNYVATARFGYWLGEPYWGKGYGTAAVRAMLSLLALDRRFARLEASVFEWNPQSMRVLEKAGFAREGVLRSSITKDGQLIDSVLYARIFPGGSVRAPTSKPAQEGDKSR